MVCGLMVLSLNLKTSGRTTTGRGLRTLFSLFEKRVIKVGLFGDRSGDNEGVAVADIGTWNEQGTFRNGKQHIPPRPVVKGWIDKNERKTATMLNNVARAVFNRPSVENVDQAVVDQAYKTVGLKVEAGMKRLISQGISPPNAQRTVDKKGSSKPLVDTGQLKSSYTFKVEDRD